MRSKLRNSTENVIRLAALERTQQLERISDNENVIDKQLDIMRIANEIILRANKAPKGVIEVVFLKESAKREERPEKLMLMSDYKVATFNVEEPSKIHSLFRTVIVVDKMWSDNIRVFQSEYGLNDSYLK